MSNLECETKENEILSFSLILGTIGRTREVECLLSSLEAQTYRDYELIVVDQNPDDRLVQILAPYKGEFPILHLKSEPGLSRAFNLGLEHASGDLVTFPGDDCQYPSDLLDRVAQFFSHHPETDGLTGRSIDEHGDDTNGTFDTQAGTVDRFNVWNRSTAYTFFLRSDSLHGARFDEDMGPGAGTIWGAGNDHDFLLQLLTKGASLYYDPELIVLHPDPASQYDDDEQLIRRAYTYDCGAGRAIRKHGFPLWFRVWWLIRPLGGLALYLVGLKKPPGARYRWNVLKGRFRGLLVT
jgi:glycosyltransferase involved in cell wall biosynthesis